MEYKNDFTMEEVGEKIRYYRKLCGFSQEELALSCDIDRSYISSLERGIQNATVAMIVRIAKGLNVKPFELLMIEKEENSEKKVKSNLNEN